MKDVENMTQWGIDRKELMMHDRVEVSNRIKQLTDDAPPDCPTLKDLLGKAFTVTDTKTATIFIFDTTHVMNDFKNFEKIIAGSCRGRLDIIQETQRTGDISLARRIIETKRPYLCNDVEHDPYYFPSTNEIKAYLGVPVFYQEQVIEVIILQSSERDHFNEAHQAALQDLAHELSTLIKRIQFTEWARSNHNELCLIGKSEAIKKVEHLVERFGRAHCHVLITGETGTGKEVIAHALHFNSPRKDQPFIIVNCGAFTSDDLLADELFGHVKGAFTDAKFDKKGKFELADGGTLFLDEVSCMRPQMQSALLRVLRYGEIQKLGDEESKRKVNVRIIAASNQDLKQLVERGCFRGDVYSRLKAVEIKVPLLRERKEDIPLLVNYFLKKFSQKDKVPLKSVSSEALEALVLYHWPDNVAGLENAIRAALLLAVGEEIQLKDIPEEIVMNNRSLDLKENGYVWTAEGVYRKIIGNRESFWELVYKPFKNHDITRTDVIKLLHLALNQTKGNYKKAAELLGIQDMKCYKKLLAFLVNNRCITKPDETIKIRGQSLLHRL